MSNERPSGGDEVEGLTRAQKILKGIAILVRLYEDADFHAEHDEIYVGGPDPRAMLDEDVKTLNLLGFTWNGRYEAWHRFV